ncbi:transmembrane protein, putative [Medicago truncatula]|uniref:Transmembrane protein, putative n=1 Tax=Medicago truncatula TaxID=3880 RepID=A0A072TNH1_MEDTR|nr:transmembrane protein, putative [Medicago truncatula]
MIYKFKVPSFQSYFVTIIVLSILLQIMYSMRGPNTWKLIAILLEKSCMQTY